MLLLLARKLRDTDHEEELVNFLHALESSPGHVNPVKLREITMKM